MVLLFDGSGIDGSGIDTSVAHTLANGDQNPSIAVIQTNIYLYFKIKLNGGKNMAKRILY